MRRSAHGQQGLPFFEKLLFHLRIRQIKKHVSFTVQSIVDLGCGYHAHFLTSMREHYPIERFVGIDVSVNERLNDGDRFELKKGDLNDVLPLPEASIELVTSLAVLEHLDKPQFHLEQIYRIMKPGGTLLLTTPSPSAKPVLEFLAFKLHILSAEEIHDHKNYFNSHDLRRMLGAAGFLPEKIKANTFLIGFNNIVVCTK